METGLFLTPVMASLRFMRAYVSFTLFRSMALDALQTAFDPVSSHCLRRVLEPLVACEAAEATYPQVADVGRVFSRLGAELEQHVWSLTQRNAVH